MLDAHLELLKKDGHIESLEAGKAGLQDYAFSRDFSFVMTGGKDANRQRYGCGKNTTSNFASPQPRD